MLACARGQVSRYVNGLIGSRGPVDRNENMVKHVNLLVVLRDSAHA